MDPVAHRVGVRFASRLQLGPAVPEEKATAALQRMKKLYARSQHDLQTTIVSAAYYARKLDKTLFVYSGNSNMHAVWRASMKPSEYLDPINNTGSLVYSVSPALEVARHEIKRA